MEEPQCKVQEKINTWVLYCYPNVPAHLMNSFINSFSKLSQKVIVRHKKELLSKIPENVLVVDWLPQHDLLGEQLYNCETLNLFWSSAIML